jgi:glutamate-1-semialdehyde 2,1-aminomutase
MLERQAKAHGIADNFRVGGTACSPFYLTLDAKGESSLALRTLFLQEMIRNGVLMPWVALCHRHDEKALELTESAVDKAFAVYRRALEHGVETYLEGPVIKPVFRRFN